MLSVDIRYFKLNTVYVVSFKKTFYIKSVLGHNIKEETYTITLPLEDLEKYLLTIKNKYHDSVSVYDISDHLSETVTQ